jgi:hypothetical protein
MEIANTDSMDYREKLGDLSALSGCFHEHGAEDLFHPCALALGALDLLFSVVRDLFDSLKGVTALPADIVIRGHWKDLRE